MVEKEDEILQYCFTNEPYDYYKDKNGWLYVRTGNQNFLSVQASQEKYTFWQKVKRMFKSFNKKYIVIGNIK